MKEQERKGRVEEAMRDFEAKKDTYYFGSGSGKGQTGRSRHISGLDLINQYIDESEIGYRIADRVSDPQAHLRCSTRLWIAGCGSVSTDTKLDWIRSAHLIHMECRPLFDLEGKDCVD